MDKIKVFEQELQFFTNDDIRQFIATAIGFLPDYFFKVAASSTGKFHPSYALGEGGLVRHTKAAVRFANHILSLEQSQLQFDQRQRDLILAALILHDGWKHGSNGSAYTTFDHPLVAAKWVCECTQLKGIIPEDDMKTIASLISSHMGQWCDSKRSSTVLPKPVSEMQKIVHLCDYLASRKDIIVSFSGNDEPQQNDSGSLETYALSFSKYNGKLLVDVFKSDPGYIRWLSGTEIRNPLLRKYVDEILKR